MKIMIVVGARPNFMKAAPVVFAIHDHNARIAALPGVSQTDSRQPIQPVLVHTGQHYDEAMSGSFFTDLGLPKPDVHLEVGSGSHAVQTAEIMRRFEKVVLDEKPDVVMVFGDVNSTVACALVTSKIMLDSNGKRPLIAHVEAGLRSFDRAMPEEINRVVTDHLSDQLFVTEESGKENLRREGIAPEKIHFVGNTMIDSLLASEEKAGKSVILDQLGLRGNSSGSVKRYALLTLHRPSNVDDRETFLSILEGIEELSKSYPVLFSAHPRTRKRIAEFGLERFFQPDKGTTEETHTPGIHLLNPLGYLDFLCLMKNATLVVTDSGGIQEETTCLRVPCVTVRDNTERPVTVTHGTNVIAGTKPENIRPAVSDQLRRQKPSSIPEKWDGRAAERIVAMMVAEFARRDSLSAGTKGPGAQRLALGQHSI
ncbi:MAG: non-hydrolyzing UDP-N-acetylglucosamine 2-epimerase [Candidatus Sulfotelmatobacter sp.]